MTDSRKTRKTTKTDAGKTQKTEAEGNGATTATGAAGGQAEAGRTQAGGADPRKSIDKTMALGNALWLMTQSKLHKGLFVSDLEWLLMPPVALGQFRIWFHENKLPIGFATWAFLTPEAEARVREQSSQRLRPDEWKGGDSIWLMDLIFPYGGMEEATQEIRTQVFPGKTLKALQPAPDGKSLAVVEW